ncbi:glycosyltransferase, partial [Psychrobacter piechaudii]|uniref:glycosyltransferase n=1 Tax=Psychrobacter piechaudii TaxID=1945521 RepID=UPI001428C2AE
IIYPFTYFIPPSNINNSISSSSNKFIFIFCGFLGPRKRPKLIIDSLKRLVELGRDDFELWIVGSGDLEQELRTLSKKYGLSVKWFGFQNIDNVRRYISEADCLLLPSKHDGWGVVASEAIIEGTPVICSDSCGVAGVVAKSGYGSVFRTNDTESFISMLVKHYDCGKVSEHERNLLKKWGSSLTAPQGARYVDKILFSSGNIKPTAPFYKN